MQLQLWTLGTICRIKYTELEARQRIVIGMADTIERMIKAGQLPQEDATFDNHPAYQQMISDRDAAYEAWQQAIKNYRAAADSVQYARAGSN